MRSTVLSQVNGPGHTQAAHIDHRQRVARGLSAVIGDDGRATVGRHGHLVRPLTRGQRHVRPAARDVDDTGRRGRLVGHHDGSAHPVLRLRG
jgi:hypothetical protein